ncbi:MAG: hypothetical protein JJU06_05975 [Ectothiorhodospiraceae bacterium]|nr:hypothetical protein [Ectothiorhodospiraceae bacterium]
MTNDEAIDQVGRAADALDNLATGLVCMPGLDPSIHIAALKESLPQLRDELREAYIQLTGENPWETHP